MKTLYKILCISLCMICLSTVSCMAQITGTPNLVSFANGLISPVCIANAGDSRLFVIDQHGLIRIIHSDGTVNPIPFLNISNRVTFGGEQGLLGIAFHPQYKTNGYFYVNYVGVSDSTHISRFSVSSTDPDVADPSSELKLMTIFQPYANHNGGDLVFGADGYLYIGLGDGGSGGDPGNRAQNLMEYLGKILRIDVNQGMPYSVPASNPFYNSSNARKEIWAYGLRNPWRFSFDRLTHDLWIADVGETAYEELDLQPASSTGGENYGWRCYEGNVPFNSVGCGSSSTYTFPVYTYPHGPECAVIGGYMNRFSSSSPYYGYYFFADYCSDKIWTLHQVSGNWVVADFGQFPGNNLSAFGEDMNGQLYVAGRTSGTIYRINDIPTVVENHVSSIVKVMNFPGTGKIRVETGRNDGTEMHLSLYNALGENTFNSVTRESSYVIDLNFLPKGIYFLNVNLDGRNSFHKFINGQ